MLNKKELPLTLPEIVKLISERFGIGMQEAESFVARALRDNISKCICCSYCGGSGRDRNNGEQACPYCNGCGRVPNPEYPGDVSKEECCSNSSAIKNGIKHLDKNPPSK